MENFFGENTELFGKYKIEKADGSPVAPNAEYFVLRIDTDVHARIALQAYIKSINKEQPKFAGELSDWLAETQNSPAGNEELNRILESKREA